MATGGGARHQPKLPELFLLLLAAVVVCCFFFLFASSFLLLLVVARRRARAAARPRAVADEAWCGKATTELVIVSSLAASQSG